MRTLIRLQNKGCRNHPYWWIVIQGSYTKLSGRFIEHVGYWIPRQTKTVQRAMILNKPRIQYWLAMGAQPSKSVQRMLSHVNMMPKPFVECGRKYNYEKQPKESTPKPYPGVRLYEKNDETAIERRKREEMNVIEREFRAQYEIEKHVKFDASDIDKVELVESDIEDADKRSQTFFDLRKSFLELERDSKKLSSAKKELLFRKMNKLASQGLKDVNQKDTKTSVFPKSPKERVEKEIKLAQWRELLKHQHQKATQDQEMLKPITSDEFMNHMMQHNNLPQNKMKERVNELFEDAAKHGIVLSKQDAKEATSTVYRDIGIMELVNTDPKQEIIPTRKPITPFPDIKDYDPQNYYDSRVSYLHPQNPNKAYETHSLNISSFNKNFRYRYKNQKGRTSKMRVTFSTLNKPSSSRPTVTHDNMAVAYTGLMRKIQSKW